MVFNAIFNLIAVIIYYCGQYINPCFTGVLLTSTLHNILSKFLAAFPHNHFRKNEREVNSFAIIIINAWKEYWQSRGSNQQLPVLKSCTLFTELWGSVLKLGAMRYRVTEPNEKSMVEYFCHKVQDSYHNNLKNYRNKNKLCWK